VLGAAGTLPLVRLGTRSTSTAAAATGDTDAVGGAEAVRGAAAPVGADGRGPFFIPITAIRCFAPDERGTRAGRMRSEISKLLLQRSALKVPVDTGLKRCTWNLAPLFRRCVSAYGPRACGGNARGAWQLPGAAAMLGPVG
jgi:hypothetical protein